MRRANGKPVRDDHIQSEYLYQLYAYLMSQTGAGIHADQAEGVLLFVVANDCAEIDQTVHIQGHRIRFLFVDLAQHSQQIRERFDRRIALDG